MVYATEMKRKTLQDIWLKISYQEQSHHQQMDGWLNGKSETDIKLTLGRFHVIITATFVFTQGTYP